MRANTTDCKQYFKCTTSTNYNTWEPSEQQKTWKWRIQFLLWKALHVNAVCVSFGTKTAVLWLLARQTDGESHIYTNKWEEEREQQHLMANSTIEQKGKQANSKAHMQEYKIGIIYWLFAVQIIYDKSLPYYQPRIDSTSIGEAFSECTAQATDTHTYICEHTKKASRNLWNSNVINCCCFFLLFLEMVGAVHSNSAPWKCVQNANIKYWAKKKNGFTSWRIEWLIFSL